MRNVWPTRGFCTIGKKYFLGKSKNEKSNYIGKLKIKFYRPVSLFVDF
jgi:hypothetical protein